jgi:hypothetical protein
MMQGTYNRQGFTAQSLPISRQIVVGVILAVALFSFEIFNFDTTRYALDNLLGGVKFVGVGWASILAVAFCAIDFAGLAHLFTPERGMDEPKEVWFLMIAWLLGATMNALMTWWAVSLTLVSHPFVGNEVLSRAQLLDIVPIFVAVLVWLTRIMFIGAMSVAGEHLFRPAHEQRQQQVTRPQLKTQVSQPTYTKQPPKKVQPKMVQQRRPSRPQTPQRRATYGSSSGYGRQPAPMSASSRSYNDGFDG